MRFADEGEAITYIFESMRAVKVPVTERGADELWRDPTPTERLLTAVGVLSSRRTAAQTAATMEYAVVTGSKGKGSVTAISAKLLQHLGHTVGMITSPHLVSYRERIRVNGRMIPEADLVRITNDLAPEIDRITATFTGNQYFSPQGIFLAIALQWFNEQNVNAAVLEVGRGGRFDDIAVVPNKLSLFTPIMLEHTTQLGATLARIAWHKAGIIKAQSYAYSVPQPPEVLEVLEAEADMEDAEFNWIAPIDMGEFVRVTDDRAGIIMRLHRYGELMLSMRGRYEVENVTLAVQGVGNMHARLPGVDHGSHAYVEAIRTGLANVKWAGRLQKMQDQPAVWVDGTTTVAAARSVLTSLQDDITRPLIVISAVPRDRDFVGVFEVLGNAADALILTKSDINPNILFPPDDTAYASARRFNDDVSFRPNLPEALDLAREKAGTNGTILIAAAQPLVGETMLIYGQTFEEI